MTKEHLYRLLIWSIRLLVASVFIFSGFVKAVDPWGTAIKLSEYFHAFGLDFLSGTSMICSVAMGAGEMLLGFALLFRLREALSALLVVVVMAFFTALTLLIALSNPVADCGCFGDAIKLTNWETFYKNLILLPLSILLWHVARKSRRSERESLLVESSMLFMFTLFGLGVGAYALQHLPLVDLLPYHIGVNIPAQQKIGSHNHAKTILIYRDKASESNQEFALTDTTWYDTTRWEFVDTRVIDPAKTLHEATTLDFALFNNQGDVTQEILTDPKELFIITLTHREQLAEKCRTQLLGLAQYAQRNALSVVGVTTSSLDESDHLNLGEGVEVPLYNMDGTTLKTLIRTTAGVVLLKEGTILAKWSCRDLPDFSEQTNPQPLSVVLSAKESTREWTVVAMMVALLVLIYLSYVWHKRK